MLPYGNPRGGRRGRGGRGTLDHTNPNAPQNQAVQAWVSFGSTAIRGVGATSDSPPQYYQDDYGREDWSMGQQCGGGDGETTTGILGKHQQPTDEGVGRKQPRLGGEEFLGTDGAGTEGERNQGADGGQSKRKREREQHPMPLSSEVVKETNKKVICVDGTITEEKFFCSLCLAQLNSRKNLQKHIFAHEHIKRISALHSKRDDQFFCKICCCQCPHQEVYDQHIRGKKHLRALQLSEQIKSHQFRPIGEMLEPLLEESSEVVKEGDGLSMGLSENMMMFLRIPGPFIGLQYGVENEDVTGTDPATFTCTLCNVSIDAGNSNLHFTSSAHRVNVLRKDYPKRWSEIHDSDYTSRAKKPGFNDKLKEIAAEIESKEGRKVELMKRRILKSKVGKGAQGSSHGAPRGRGGGASVGGRKEESPSAGLPQQGGFTHGRGGKSRRGQGGKYTPYGQASVIQKPSGMFQQEQGGSGRFTQQEYGGKGRFSHQEQGGRDRFPHQERRGKGRFPQQEQGGRGRFPQQEQGGRGRFPQQEQGGRGRFPQQPPAQKQQHVPQSYRAQTTPQRPRGRGGVQNQQPRGEGSYGTIPPSTVLPSSQFAPPQALPPQMIQFPLQAASTQFFQPPPFHPPWELGVGSADQQQCDVAPMTNPLISNPWSSNIPPQTFSSSSSMDLPPASLGSSQPPSFLQQTSGQEVLQQSTGIAAMQGAAPGQPLDSTMKTLSEGATEKHSAKDIQQMAASLVQSEEQAEAALQLSSALTQALLAYRIKSVSNSIPDNPLTTILNSLQGLSKQSVPPSGNDETP